MKYAKVFLISCLALSILMFLFFKCAYYVISPPDPVYTHDPAQVTADNPTGLRIKHASEGINIFVMVLMVIIFFVGGIILFPAGFLTGNITRWLQIPYTWHWFAPTLVVILTSGAITLFVYWCDRVSKKNSSK